MITYNIHQAYIGKYIVLHYVNNMVKLVANFSSCELGFSGKFPPGSQWKQFQRTPGRPGTRNQLSSIKTHGFFSPEKMFETTQEQRKNLPVIVTRVFFYFWIFTFVIVCCLVSFSNTQNWGNCIVFFFPCLNHWPPAYPGFFSSLERRRRKKHRI